MQIALPKLELLLREDDHAATFGRFIGQRGQLRRVGELRLRDPGGRQEGRRLPVTERDGSGLVEQQHIHVARRFHSPSRHGQHVGLQHAIHARDTDGR